MTDREDITEVLVRYATGIDRRDWQLFRTVFTTDCALDYGDIGSWSGVDEVTTFMEQAHAMAGHTMHRLSNHAITIDGDTASARTYVDGLILGPDNASGVNAVGFYDDELVRTAEGWKIARRRFTAVRVVGLAFGASDGVG
jgi:3-phenylpropionate/cinnamic acid dioxygenase small subunit